MKKLCNFMALGLFVCCIPMCLRSDDEWLSSVATQFGFEAWRGTTVVNYTKIVSAVDWSSLNIATNGMATSVLRTMRPGLARLIIFNDIGDSAMLRTEANIWNSVLLAQKAMLWRFAHMMTTVDYSSFTNNIGDRGYTLQNRIIFVRNNVVVDVLSYTNAISAEAVARQIDADILRRSTEAAR